MKVKKFPNIKKYYGVFFLFMVILIIIGLACRLTDETNTIPAPAELLPVSDDISGFAAKGELVVMTDRQEIAEAIDGAVEKYTEHGFVEGAFQFFSNGTIGIDVKIFDYGITENAKKTYLEFYPSTPEVISQGEMDAVLDHGIITGYTLNYSRKNIFVELNSDKKDAVALNVLKLFLYNIDGKIENASFD